MTLTDIGLVIVWWLIVQALGWTVWPLAFRALRWLPDRGYMLAKPLGLLLVSYVLWLSASLRILPNDLFGIGVAWLSVAAISVIVYRRRSPDDVALRVTLRQHARLLIAYEVLFAVALIAWVIFRAHVPDAASGEKPMEQAFLNAIARSDFFPPHDPWLAGFNIAYYYFGYVMLSLLRQISNVGAGVVLSLGTALWFALSAAGAFAVVADLVLLLRGRARAAIFYGLIGALLLVLVSNWEAPLEVARVNNIGSPEFWQQLDILDLNQPYAAAEHPSRWPPRTEGFGWWWRASRVIHDYWPTTITAQLSHITGLPPDSNADFQELIDEFPQFSFIHGDLHPHVLGLPFVLLAVGLALNVFQAGLTGARSALRDFPVWWLYPIVLGGLSFLNTWDFPIYTGLVIVALNVGRGAAGVFRWRWLVLDVLLFGALGWLLYLPFYQHFTSQAAGLSPNIFNGTSAAQFLIMFGPFVVIGLIFGAKLWIDARRAGQIRSGVFTIRALGLAALVLLVALSVTIGLALITYQTGLANVVVQLADRGLTLNAHVIGRLLDPWLPILLALALAILFGVWLARRAEQTPLTLIMLLYWIGLWLTFVPEFVYVTDITGTRMNTVFKFYYQAWVLWSVAAAGSLFHLFSGSQRITSRLWRGVVGSAVALAIALGLFYPALAIPTRLADFANVPPGLNVLQAAAARDPQVADAYAAVQWLNHNASGAPVVLQTTNDLPWFEPERARIASWTGLPTVLGWYNHETQWRGNTTVQQQRLPDIYEIYSTRDESRARQLLQKYAVVYVYVGYEERQQYPAEALLKFERMFPVVFQQNGVTIYRVS
jgi:YYY domain-containing protein